MSSTRAAGPFGWGAPLPLRRRAVLGPVDCSSSSEGTRRRTRNSTPPMSGAASSTSGSHAPTGSLRFFEQKEQPTDGRDALLRLEGFSASMRNRSPSDGGTRSSHEGTLSFKQREQSPHEELLALVEEPRSSEERERSSVWMTAFLRTKACSRPTKTAPPTAPAQGCSTSLYERRESCSLPCLGPKACRGLVTRSDDAACVAVRVQRSDTRSACRRTSLVATPRTAWAVAWAASRPRPGVSHRQASSAPAISLAHTRPTSSSRAPPASGREPAACPGPPLRHEEEIHAHLRRPGSTRKRTR
jgi:hypothetical protein